MENAINWDDTLRALNERGYATITNVLAPAMCEALIRQYNAPHLYRSIIEMERYRFGKGEYRYFQYPLPEFIATVRKKFYNPLSIIANEWVEKLGGSERFPSTHDALIKKCHQQGQLRPTPLILRYEQGGFNTLHQDLYGDVYFPFQIVFPLTQQGVDHEGGEFILTEQVPRAQSKAQVVPLNKGDALIFTTNSRPVKGTRGYYRATMKHGVSEVRSGVRYSLGIIFHDAT